MQNNLIPLPAKLAFTAFMAVLVPVYWYSYGPKNFLYFCDVALFLTLITVWTEKPLFASAAAVGILLPQLFWQIDFLCGLLGWFPLGMTDYMFDEKNMLFTRGLSFFHFWLPLFLLYLLHRVGYDRRAGVLWTGLALALLLFCYFVMPAPPVTENQKVVNINYVYGMTDTEPQSYMPPLAWLGSLLVGLPLLVYLPTHLLLRKVFPVAAPTPVTLAEEPSPA